jgi:alpha-beta hydrolase superfamily lysophospholipase
MSRIAIDVRIDVTEAAGTGERLHTAATVFLPASLDDHPIAIFAWPGGGYNRRYFDLRLDGGSAYSQAADHTSRGMIFVACDHLAVGDSSVPKTSLSHADLGRVNAATAAAILARLKDGTLDPAVDTVPDLIHVGIGQSYGGLLLTLLQADHPTFAGVGFLGWSGINTVVPHDPQHPLIGEMFTGRVPGLRHPYRHAFHWDDVPDEIVAADLEGYPHRNNGAPVPAWAAPFMPGGPNVARERPPLGPAVVEEASRIDVPVLVAVGERDVCPDPRSEPTAYRRSPDITVSITPAMAHMHNFAGTRTTFWRRIASWAQGVASGST